MTYEEAMAKIETKWWEDKTYKEIVDFQLYEERLCCPLSVFQEAMEKVLDRPVYTHEFADFEALQNEYEGKKPYDGLLPSIKRIAGNKPILIVNPYTGKVFSKD